MDKKRIAVVGLEDGPCASFGPAFLASLNADCWHRIGIVADKNESGALRESLLDEVFELPSIDSQSFGSSLLSFVHEQKIDAIIPGSTGACFALAQEELSLHKAGVALASLESGACAWLQHNSLLGLRNELVDPIANLELVPASVEEWNDHPWFAIQAYPGILLMSSGEAHYVVDEWEARRAFSKHQGMGREVYYCGWNSNQSFQVFGLWNKSGDEIGAAAARVYADDKNLRPWMAVSVNDNRLFEIATSLVKRLRLSGPVSFLMRQVGRHFEAVDIRPGFPMWLEMTKNTCPLADAAIEQAIYELNGLQAANPCGRLAPGILFSQTADDIVVDLNNSIHEKLHS